MIFLLFLFITTFANSQSINANFERKFADIYDKEYIQVTIQYSKQININWEGYVDYIIVESDNGFEFPVINCERTSQLNLSNLSKGIYYLKFLHRR
jgi:hypothetical protein